MSGTADSSANPLFRRLGVTGGGITHFKAPTFPAPRHKLLVARVHWMHILPALKFSVDSESGVRFFEIGALTVKNGRY